MKRLREERGWTQTDLARHLSSLGLKFHQQTVQRIEAGERPVRLDEAYLIALIFGEPLERMSSTTAPQERTLQSAVDQLRYEARSIADELHRIMTDNWQETTVAVAAEADGRLPPQGTRARDMDPAARWALEWSITALRAYEALLTAAQTLDRIEGGQKYVRLPPDLDVFDDIRKWRAQFRDVLRWSPTKDHPLPPVPDSDLRAGTDGER
jgi:transcriptional regulator with XRE-family HTH domain